MNLISNQLINSHKQRGSRIRDPFSIVVLMGSLPLPILESVTCCRLGGALFKTVEFQDWLMMVMKMMKLKMVMMMMATWGVAAWTPGRLCSWRIPKWISRQSMNWHAALWSTGARGLLTDEQLLVVTVAVRVGPQSEALKHSETFCVQMFLAVSLCSCVSRWHSECWNDLIWTDCVGSGWRWVWSSLLQRLCGAFVM